MTIRIMLVDDHEMVRRGLVLMLQAFDDLELVGEAVNGVQALEICSQVQPDVILMDLIMPEMDGIQATSLILERCPHARVLVLTSFSEQERIQEALKAGAIGYMLKDSNIDQLAGAIRSAYAGKASLSQKATDALISMATRSAIGHDLTGREREVLALMVDGLNNPQIAARLGIGRATVKSHVSNLLQKLEVQSRTEAVALALKNNLVKSDSSPPTGG